MPFNHLLFESLQPGKTRAEDKENRSYTSTDLKPGSGETVLLFHLDKETTRKQLGLSGKKCYDFLYFYKSSSQCFLIFVELKGSNFANAGEQLSNAIDAICRPHGQSRSLREHVRAVIVTPTISPEDRKELTKEMRKQRIPVFFGNSKKDKPCLLKEIEGLF
jgi:hypothetical protein